jgi:hypothetical protein
MTPNIKNRKEVGDSSKSSLSLSVSLVLLFISYSDLFVGRDGVAKPEIAY